MSTASKKFAKRPLRTMLGPPPLNQPTPMIQELSKWVLRELNFMREIKFLVAVLVAGLVTPGFAPAGVAAQNSKTIMKRGVKSPPSGAEIAVTQSGPITQVHYATNGNFGAKGNYLPGKAGFNLADVSNVRQLDALPAGVRGLAWIGQCNGVDGAFLDAVRPFVGNPKLFGFYLMDDPDPMGKYSSLCTAENLKAESDWIHAHIRGAQTFIVLMTISSSNTPSFSGTYNPDNSHIDLFGIDPYPCRTELNGCDFAMIDRYVTAAESWGVPRERMVPVYQTFGGGDWVDDGGGKYALPSASQEQKILTRWRALVPTPVFDFAYSWGSQKKDLALGSSSDLKELFSVHNSTTQAPKKSQAELFPQKMCHRGGHLTHHVKQSIDLYRSSRKTIEGGSTLILNFDFAKPAGSFLARPIEGILGDQCRHA